jgi:serine/threonine-protein kinase HipA
MCFNIFSHNQDDHAKNFSFIYNEEEKMYRLSPAYDLTYSSTYYGEHMTSVNGKGKNILDSDLLDIGIKSGMNKNKCNEIIKEIKEKVNIKLKNYLQIIN